MFISVVVIELSVRCLNTGPEDRVPFKDHSQLQEMIMVCYPTLLSGQIRLDISHELSAILVLKKTLFSLQNMGRCKY